MDEIEYQLKLIIINLPIAIATTAVGKIAIGFTILRIFGNTSPRKKWSVWVMLMLLTVVSLFDILLALFRCGAPSTQWNLLKLAATNCAISSLAYDRFNYFTIAVQAFSDYYFSVLPMVVVWNLKMNRRPRIVIVFLLGLTLITGGVATAKLVVMQALIPTTDITGDSFQISLMFSLEAAFIIVFGSIPVLKPIRESCLSMRQSARRLRLLGQPKKLTLGSPNKQTVIIETKHDRAHPNDSGWLQAGDVDLKVARIDGCPAQPAAMVQGEEGQLHYENWSARAQGQIHVQQQLYQDFNHHKDTFELPG